MVELLGQSAVELVGEATFGAEVGRNPRSFASHLMAYDLLETGGVPRENPEGSATSMAELYDMKNNLVDKETTRNKTTARFP